MCKKQNMLTRNFTFFISELEPWLQLVASRHLKLATVSSLEPRLQRGTYFDAGSNKYFASGPIMPQATYDHQGIKSKSHQFNNTVEKGDLQIA